MILGSKKNDAALKALVPSIKAHIDEWQIVTVVAKESCTLTKDEILARVMDLYQDYEGLVYPQGDRKLTCLVRLGRKQTHEEIQGHLEGHMPKHSCEIQVSKVSAPGLQQIQIDLTTRGDTVPLDMFSQRKHRHENIFLVADDDMFIRRVLTKILSPYGRVVEAATGDEAISQYVNFNPDMVTLDIHMPGMDGLRVIHKLRQMDPRGFVVITSADSIKENILEAKGGGAAGFLTKPPSKEKLIAYINQCDTITKM